MQTAQPSLHKHNLYLVRSRSGRKSRDRGMKVLAAPLLVACPKWPSHHVLARGNRSFAARVSRVAARGLVEDKPLVRENRSRPGFLARVIHVRYNSTCVGYYIALHGMRRPPPRARGPSAAPCVVQGAGYARAGEGLQGAHGRGTLFATWRARMDWKKFENFFVRDSPTVSGLTVGI